MYPTTIQYICSKIVILSMIMTKILCSIQFFYFKLKEERKEKFKYNCECCDFCVFMKSMMDSHLNTHKHQLKFNDSQNINI